MKIWNIAIISLLAAVNGASSLVLDQVLHDDTFQEQYDFHQKKPYECNIIEEMFLDDCTKLEYVRNDSVKTIIATAKVVPSCSKEITRVLKSANGAIVIIGADKSAIALACLKLNTNNELFYNKYYDLPQSIKNLIDYNIYSADELDFKVYTLRQPTIDKLRSLVLDSKYDEAVEFSIYLYNSTHDDGAGKNIIKNVFHEILKENMGYQIMDYAFMLYKHDTAHKIVFACFPRVFIPIFIGQELKIYNNEKTGILRLSKEIDKNNDRWLDIDYLNSNTTDPDVYWKFSPVWNTTLNTVVFIFKHPYHNMRVKLDITLRNDERWAWGDSREVDPYGRHYEWRLVPVGFNEHDELLFNLHDTFYDSCLTLSSCDCKKEHVKGSRQSCTPDMGWILYI